MKIKSIKNLRWHYKNIVRQKKGSEYDSNFVGTYHNEGEKTINGFFELFHGDKPNIARFLPSVLKIAEDGQAIYEFLQNAVDCNSTHFFIFYNEDYFIVINNGIPFSHKDVLSILNIANTTKEQDCNKIGRFGIGFKLVHRLVGVNDGIKELTEDYKGPIIFSWSNIDDLTQLLNFDKPISTYVNNPSGFDNDTLPWLFKILVTNFPCAPGEMVKDINYNSRVLFPEDELLEAIRFLNLNFQNHQEHLNFDVLKQGTIFFLKLGKGKKQHLDKDYNDLTSGVQYSMNFLKRLQKVFINEDSLGKSPMKILNFEIEKGSEIFKKINPEYAYCNIKISFGYTEYLKAEKLRASPNFYKYFPMGDEANGFSFILHCDGFDNEANRRKLHESDINKNLLPHITKLIIEKLEELKETNKKEFLTIYSNILVSKIPVNQNNKWLNEFFFSKLLEYLRGNIPTTQGIHNDSKNIRIKKIDMEINLVDLGLEDIQWFYWSEDKDTFLLNEAQTSEKLGIEEWDLRDIFVNADLFCLNEWIKNISVNNYNLFLNELDKQYFTKEAITRLLEVKLFKFSDGAFYSIGDVFKNKDLIFLSEKIMNIKMELITLKFSISELDIFKFGFAEKIDSNLKSDEILYKELSTRTSVINNLTSLHKLNLFKNLINPDTKFIGVGDETIKQLMLFCDTIGNILALKDLLPSNLITPEWLIPFKISSIEDSDVVKKYLLQEKEIYKKLILPNWESLIINIQDPKSFYEKVVFYFNLEENNTPFSKQAFVFTKNIFKKTNEIFYNNKFLQNRNYTYFQSAVLKFIDADIPSIEILNFLKDAPFKIDNENIFDYVIAKSNTFDLDEIKSLISFTIVNNESIFEKIIIEKNNNEYLVSTKRETVFQYYSSELNRELINFISDKLSETFKLLPKELLDYKDQSGILTEHNLHNKILDFIDVDENIEQLIDIIRYNDPKRKLLDQLSNIHIKVGEFYNVESLQFKILDLACKELTQDYQQEIFRDKILIEADYITLKLSSIPSSNDEIKFENETIKLSLAQILPNAFQYSNFLNDIVNYFVNLGIPDKTLKSLLGIINEPDYNNILDLIGKDIENAQQLAFILLYNKNIDELKFKEYNIETFDGKFSLEYTYYANQFSFIDANATLNKKYFGIINLLEIPIDIDKKNGTKIISEPYFTDNSFVCEYLKSELDKDECLDLINFIYNKWQINKNINIKNINWEKINCVETQTLLGFNPVFSVFPNEFAIESEQLPEYLQGWAANDIKKINFLGDFGVWTENSVLVKLRKYFSNNVDTFNISQIAQESRFANEKLLFNIFLYLKENEIVLQNNEQLDTLNEIKRIINIYRKNGDEFNIEEEFDEEILENQSFEWDPGYYLEWKTQLNDKFTIFLFPGVLPKYIWAYCTKLYKEFKNNGLIDWYFSSYKFYKFNCGEIFINSDNKIYINQNADIKKSLSSLIAEENDFTTEELLLLYQTKETILTGNDEVTELKRKVQDLEALIENLTRVSGRDPNDITTKIDEYTNIIKEKSEEYLFNYLKEQFPDFKIIWLNSGDDNNFVESWENHDFEIQDNNGRVINYIDCKGTTRSKRTFYLTQNEWEFFLNNKEIYQIYRILNVGNNESVFVIDNLMDWINSGKVVPYLESTETIKGGRVFLTIK